MDEDLRRLERSAAGGDPQAARELARRYERLGHDALAYLHAWRVGAAAELAGARARLTDRQRPLLEALDAPPHSFQVALAARRHGPRPWHWTWRWTSPARALRQPPAPVLGLRADHSVTQPALAAALADLPTVVALELMGCRVEDLPRALSGARFVATLRLGGLRLGARALDSLRGRLRSLVHVAYEPYRGAEPVTEAQLRALARFPRLACVELRGRAGLSAAGLTALAQAPAMTWIHVEDCPLKLEAARAAARAAPPGVGLGLPRATLRQLLPPALAEEVQRLLSLRLLADAEGSRCARRVSRELLAAGDRPSALRATAPLLALGLQREPRWGSAAAVAELAEEGVEAPQVLPALVQLRQRPGRLGAEATRALRRCGLLGWDLAPVAGRDEDLASLAAACRRMPAEVRRALVAGTRWGFTRSASQTLLQALERGLASQDPTDNAAASRAALDLASSGPGLLGLLTHAGLGGEARALEAIPPLLRRGLPLDEEALGRLGACAGGGGADAAAAGAILWTAARRGHAMRPALQRLAPDAAGLRWDVAGAAPALAERLRRLGVEEVLPPGVSRAQRSAPGPGSRPHQGRACGACGGRDTECVFYEGGGDVSGGSEEWESRCRDCGLYTLEEREWG